MLLMLCLCLSAAQAGKRAFMWIDGEANFKRFSHTDSIRYYVQKVHDLGFTDLVVDVRPITGEVLFDSKTAPRMRDWQGFQRPDFDYLGTFIQAAHALGMRVEASLNVFCAGHNYFDRGQIYSGHPEWASVVYTPEGLKPITEQKQKYGAMVNPLNQEYRKHIIEVLRELTGKYPSLDGLVLDRVRYDGIEADFSRLSQETFQRFLHQEVQSWPQDIFTWQQGKVVRGKYFKQWVRWRSQVIRDFMAEMRRAVKDVNPHIEFGTYTGAWYPSYYEVGVNFASNRYNPYPAYDWATEDYHTTGYMELLDLYITGNYYTDITVADAQKNTQGVRNETDSQLQTGTWYSVEGACKHLQGILNSHPFYGGMLVDQLYGQPERISEAVEMNLRHSDGLMVFDICHLIARPQLWGEIEEGMRKGGMIP
uniref:DUF4985 domain-containing protein n=1 Tax=Prevotella sp. GTC17259 TaxID=3236795 RepID=A0AB33J4P1_9BACT